MNAPVSSKFSNRDEVQQLSEYRRFNLVALISAALGVASLGLLSSPFLVILPLLAIFLGACGLGLYHRREEIGGRLPAWIGIGLGLFFISWAASQFCFSRCVYYSEADGVVRDWLKLVVSGEREIAHQAMLNIASRQATGLSVDEYYAMDQEAAEKLQEVFSEPPISDLVSIGADANLRLIKNVSLLHDLDSTLIEQVYRISPADGEPLDLKVATMRRFNKAAGKATWMINGAEISQEPSSNFVERVSALVTRLVAR